MLQIQKQTPPVCIAQLQRTPGASWSSVSGAQKDSIRKFLLLEQGFVCAYCTRRIYNNNKGCTVEHWRPRSVCDTDHFHWDDLLAVCDGGGAGSAPKYQHCDRKRGNESLKIHPARPGAEANAHYIGTGEIILMGDEKILNLNLKILKDSRKAIMTMILTKAGDIQETRKQLQYFRTINQDGHRPEYGGIAIYFLEKRLKSLESKAQRTKGTRVR